MFYLYYIQKTSRKVINILPSIITFARFLKIGNMQSNDERHQQRRID